MDRDFKFLPLKVGELNHPIIFIGQNPGMKGYNDSPYAWDGDTNVTRLLRRAIGIDRENLIFTNVCNYKDITQLRVKQGIDDILKLVETYQPKKIICLGNFAYEHISPLDLGVQIKKVYHPSFILRIDYNESKYAENIRSLL